MIQHHMPPPPERVEDLCPLCEPGVTYRRALHTHDTPRGLRVAAGDWIGQWVKAPHLKCSLCRGTGLPELDAAAAFRLGGIPALIDYRTVGVYADAVTP